MKKVMLIGNSEIVIYNFRLEFIETLIKQGYEVYLAFPYGTRADELIKMGCRYYDISIDRHGKNVLKDLKLLNQYHKLIKKILPDIVFTFTIKPTIYGAIACRQCHIPCIPTITGLGSSLNNGVLLSKLISKLYRFSLKKVPLIFFQNKENQKYFWRQNIWRGNSQRVMGSGVNLEKFPLYDFPPISPKIHFLFIGRIMREKGINELLDAIKILRSRYSNIELHLCGFLEEDYANQIQKMERDGMLIYHGMVDDIRYLIKQAHCIVLPSYHEGMSNALLEAASCGRPLIASDVSGCKEIIIESENGFLVSPADSISLKKAMEKFILLDYGSMKAMGINSRHFVEKHFDRKDIVSAYMKQIKLLTEE